MPLRRVGLLMLLTLDTVAARASEQAVEFPPAPVQGPPSLPPPAPLELRLLFPPAVRARDTLTLWVAVSSDYNDNVLATSVEPTEDVSSVVTVGLTAAYQRRRGDLSLGWTGTSRSYASLDSLNDVFDQETVLLSSSYRIRPRSSISLTNLFLLNPRTSAISADGTFTGRGRSWSNSLAAESAHQLSQRNALHFGVTAGVQHFESRREEIFLGGARVEAGSVRSARWMANIAGSLDYLGLGFQGHAWAPGGRCGISVRLSPPWLLSVAAGPVLLMHSDRSWVIASGTAMLQRSIRHGAFLLQYDRSVGVAGEYGGPTVNQAAACRLAVEPFWRLVLALVPAYRTYQSPSNVDGTAIDVRVATVDLRIAAPVSGHLEILGSYAYLRQQEEWQGSVQVRDQQRALLGLRWVTAASSLTAAGVGIAD